MLRDLIYVENFYVYDYIILNDLIIKNLLHQKIISYNHDYNSYYFYVYGEGYFFYVRQLKLEIIKNLIF